MYVGVPVSVYVSVYVGVLVMSGRVVKARVRLVVEYYQCRD